MSNSENFVEEVVCNVKEVGGKLPQMKEVDVGDAGKCLLIRHEDGQFTALGHKCTHYGAPLARGALSQGTIRCPWHGACFNAKTGDIEDYPGLDSLQKYQVTVDRSGNVKVKAKVKFLSDVKRNPCLESAVDMMGRDYKVLIVGGGPASLVCAETLRKEGYDGKISILCKERHPPYDRAKLSKALDAEAESIYLRSDGQYFKNINVDLLTNLQVATVDTSKKKVFLENSDDEQGIPYDKLFVATGGIPRSLQPMPGWDCSNIFLLRTLEDANKIASACKDKKVVLIGSSFIGMEIASYLTKKGECTSVSVVCGRRSKVPFESSLGEKVGECIMKIHQDKGVTFHTSAGVAELIYDSDTMKATGMKLTDSTVIDADVIILGIGVTPATDFLKSSGIELNAKGYIPVDSQMRTNIADVYAGGDIVTFPLAINGGELTNIQHWQMAHAHGRIAAYSILDSYSSSEPETSRPTHVQSVPFFWTVQFGISIRYAGHCSNFNDVIIKGVEKGGKLTDADTALAAKKFVAFYAKGDRAIAVATMMADPIAARFAQHIKANGPLKTSEINGFLRNESHRKSAKDQCNLS